MNLRIWLNWALINQGRDDYGYLKKTPKKQVAGGINLNEIKLMIQLFGQWLPAKIQFGKIIGNSRRMLKIKEVRQ